jgi:cytochrome b6-f complex iron-sulfur subunit
MEIETTEQETETEIEQCCKQKTCKREKHHEMTRGDFLHFAIPSFAALWCLMAGYPIYRYLLPKKEAEARTKVGSVTLGSINDIPQGTGKNFKFGSTPAIITHTKDGEFHAFKAVCTHLGCTVQFVEEKDLIWCACHGGCYNPETGKNVAGPPPKPLEVLDVKIVDGKIIVSNA